MSSPSVRPGLSELRAARRASRGLYWFVGLFSVFVNLLMLTGPLYMLQVYDRVLGSRSVETLVALTALVAFLYMMMGVLDFARNRVMNRAGARFQAALDRRVFDAELRRAALRPDGPGGALSDLQAVRRLMTSPVMMSAFDIPFTPLFLAGIWIFHPLLGVLALAGGAILIALAVLNQIVTRGSVETATRAGAQADGMAARLRNAAQTVRAMGMGPAVLRRWQGTRDDALDRDIAASDMTGGFTVTVKAFRLFLQSAMLGLGAWLVLQNQLTAGAMIAGSILLGRALAPIEQLVGQWPMVQRARQGWQRLGEVLENTPPEPEHIALPRPRARLDVSGLAVLPPGQRAPVLRNVSFDLQPGQALGVIGVTGAGKSTLARALTGLWPPAAGTIRLDGATLDQFPPDTLGAHIGYLPQQVQLFDGTVAENIARLASQPDAEAVVAAAQKAAAHDMILSLPQGYDTPLTGGTGPLSGGQMQRIALARALYGDPVLLVLDEPNSNLDTAGSEAVNSAVRNILAAGGAAVVIAHRPAAIAQCDRLLMLEGGTVRAFGPRDEVLHQVVRNSADIVKPLSRGTGS